MVLSYAAASVYDHTCLLIMACAAYPANGCGYVRVASHNTYYDVQHDYHADDDDDSDDGGHVVLFDQPSQFDDGGDDEVTDNGDDEKSC